MLRMFQQTYLFPGTLGANHVLKSIMPCSAQLVHVALSQTSANLGSLKIGAGSDDDAFLTTANFPNNSAAEKALPADFAGAVSLGNYPHLAKGDTLVVTITDHASHMANVLVILTFTEG